MTTLNTNTKPRAECLLLSMLQAQDTPDVLVDGYGYRVDYGPNVTPQIHLVTKLKKCQCYLGTECPAVAAVAEYLKAGGQRAPDPAFDFWPWVPKACPICGAHAEPDSTLPITKEHGHGWKCTQSGSLCYWAARTVPLYVALKLRTHIIPPVRDDGQPYQPIVTPQEYEAALAEGVQKAREWVAEIKARQRPTGKIIYPGVTASDMRAARAQALECQRA